MTNLEVNISDNSAKEFSEQFLEQLEVWYEKQDTHAMSDYTMYLQGKKDMLFDVIEYLKQIKP